MHTFRLIHTNHLYTKCQSNKLSLYFRIESIWSIIWSIYPWIYWEKIKYRNITQSKKRILYTRQRLVHRCRLPSPSPPSRYRCRGTMNARESKCKFTIRMYFITTTVNVFPAISQNWNHIVNVSVLILCLLAIFVFVCVCVIVYMLTNTVSNYFTHSANTHICCGI